MPQLHALRVDRAHTREALERTWEAGAAALILPEDAPAAQLRAQLERFRPHAVVELGPRRRWQEERLAGGLPVPAGVALVVATSGSTGEPKGVELSHDALQASVTASLNRLGARPGERWGLALPTHHIAGVSVHLRAAALGTDAVVAPDTGAVGHLDVEHVALVPAQLDRLLAEGAAVDRFATILLGGARASEDLLERARSRGARVVTSYGMSETVGGCVYDGLPLDGVEVAVSPATGRIRVRGPVLFDGYRELHGVAGDDTPGLDLHLAAETDHTDPHRTDHTDPHRADHTGLHADGWFTTPDLGHLDAGGRLEVVGRADAVLVSGGENVPLAAVEALLRTHPQVADVVVAAVEDRRWGQVPAAVVVPVHAHRPPDLAGLRAHVRSQAPAAYAPRHLVVVEELARDGLGKLPRAEVVARLRAAGLTAS